MVLSPKNHPYTKYRSLTLEATFYKTSSVPNEQTIIYIHGGGLVYGQRDDLPEDYIQDFLEAGYHFLALDYPLAPETPLKDIYNETKKGLQWFTKEYRATLGITSSAFILFGRSAGAYLSLLLAKDPELPDPTKVISFYGYYSLSDYSFQKPNAHYKKYPVMPEKMIHKLIGTSPLAKGPLQTRYALYLYARQTGKWIEYLHATQEDRRDFSLTTDELQTLPPTFIAQSIDDQDVPYRIGKTLQASIPDSYFFSVKGLEHDFDRDPFIPEAKEAYRQVIDWLSK
ncbi:alpha/beta hydrolase [Desemzia sp. RIT804]|uniref:alpha/beta hydrolase n=1 Tax=Desemzia sp. RIT 804 TaxID=2810209 RepID=UPI0019519E03|nr:alpha/beta hydrolase [Desemzia sp. RIT 804]MBM6615222.1 alpha/beta hydrolase [Desemzia sp. RIT 804]